MDECVEEFLANMRRLASLPGAGRLVEVATDNGVRWWRCPAYDLVLPRSGSVWLLMPLGSVQHPPLFGMAYANAPRDVMDSLRNSGGAVVPRGMPGTEALERLVSGTDDSEEVARLRGIIARNKAGYLRLQEVCREQRAGLAELQGLAREKLAELDAFKAEANARIEAMAGLRAEVAEVYQQLSELKQRMSLPGSSPSVGEA